jgi:hypothetical protein
MSFHARKVDRDLEKGAVDLEKGVGDLTFHDFDLTHEVV